MDFRKVIYKLRNNLIPPHRFALYAQILLSAKTAGYNILTLQDFRELSCDPPIPFLILRHDIDSDAVAALLFAEIEQQHRCQASYFFRRSTWNQKVIDTLNHQGHELGYHFEEMTDFAKRHHLKTKAEVIPHKQEIQRIFASQLAALRHTSGLELSSMAAHGDFAWKTLDLGNRFFLKDSAFRAAQDISYEAYDEALVAAYGIHVSDKPYPEGFYPHHPLDLIAERTSFLLLTHPRWWHSNPLGNFASDIWVNIQKVLW